jgi:hypothetical protein
MGTKVELRLCNHHLSTGFENERLLKERVRGRAGNGPCVCLTREVVLKKEKTGITKLFQGRETYHELRNFGCRHGN